VRDAASNESALRYEKLQAELGEGPCLAAYLFKQCSLLVIPCEDLADAALAWTAGLILVGRDRLGGSLAM
jgi:hypothetical protein